MVIKYLDGDKRDWIKMEYCCVRTNVTNYRRKILTTARRKQAIKIEDYVMPDLSMNNTLEETVTEESLQASDDEHCNTMQ